MNLHEPEQPPQEIITPDICFTPEQLAIRALVDHMDELMPWIFERMGTDE